MSGITSSSTALAAEAAEADAQTAAERAGLLLREIEDMGALAEVQQLFEAVWNVGPEGTPVTADLLRALAKSGNPVFAAYSDGALVGACFGFCSPPQNGNMHSHIAGVSPSARSRGVGLALKLRQRAWALNQGMRTMSWTFDPLIRRNAVFNLVKLGAEVVEYLPDFYGPMDDDVNRGDATDRVLLRWQLEAPIPVGTLFPPEVGSGESQPQLSPGSRFIRVPVPENIEDLRLAEPEQARRLRYELRHSLGELLKSGAKVVGFERDGHYLVRVPAHLEGAEEEAVVHATSEETQ